MEYLAAILVVVVAVEVFPRLPILTQVSATKQLAMKILAVIRSRHISDHWKERVLVRYAARLAFYSCKTGLMLLGFFVFLYIVSETIDWMLGGSQATIDFLVTVTGVAIATVVSLVYYTLRQRFV